MPTCHPGWENTEKIKKTSTRWRKTLYSWSRMWLKTRNTLLLWHLWRQLKKHQAKYGALLDILPLLSGLGKGFHGWTFWTLYFSGLSGNLSAEPWIYERIRTRRRVSTTGFIRFHFNFLFFKLWSISWITRSSWLNCALRDDEAVYWVSIGHYETVAVGNWWHWVSRGHLCLYILH